MPTVSKITPEQGVEIVRRLDAGETQLAIAKLFGVSHTTVGRHAAKERARVAAEQAAADAAAELDRRRLAHLQRLWDTWELDFDPTAPGPLFPSEECRLLHWQNRMNIAPSGREFEKAMLDRNDVHRGRLTPREVRALAEGRRLYLYPDFAGIPVGPA